MGEEPGFSKHGDFSFVNRLRYTLARGQRYRTNNCMSCK